ncbi:Hypothetical protein CM240_1303 [Clostridium bornimense]|uniref:Uncharacterized protein n=1 Tax=Clostridium bornimense TaxID=1216932 RepID=W6RUX1_9CLOT|nr:hypothetical protein [Clostridium bornimense]CDM68466.1 Hypothetical protein CM240_1303 [Clostridium bornimense]
MNKDNICEILEKNNVDILSEEENIINIIYEFDDVEIASSKSFCENDEEIENFLVELAEDNLTEILEEIEEELGVICKLRKTEYSYLSYIKYSLELTYTN